MMVWFVLKNRRHEGPYLEAQLAKLIKSGEVTPQDFIISQEKAEQGELQYQKVADVFPNWVAPPVPKDPQQTKPPAPSGKMLGEFSEEEILKSEVSRIFMESLDSGDLVKNSSEFTRTGLTQTKTKRPPAPKMSRYNPLESLKNESLETETDQPQKRAFDFKKIVVVGSFVGMFLVLATFPFFKDELKKTQAKLSQQSSPAEKAQPTQRSSSEQNTGMSSDSVVRTAPTIRVPELSDERTRRIELEREREQEKRERELVEERESREKKLQEESLEKAQELEATENLGAKDPETPIPENESGEIAESESSPQKAGQRSPASETEEHSP